MLQPRGKVVGSNDPPDYRWAQESWQGEKQRLGVVLFETGEARGVNFLPLMIYCVHE